MPLHLQPKQNYKKINFFQNEDEVLIFRSCGHGYQWVECRCLLIATFQTVQLNSVIHLMVILDSLIESLWKVIDAGSLLSSMTSTLPWMKSRSFSKSSIVDLMVASRGADPKETNRASVSTFMGIAVWCENSFGLEMLSSLGLLALFQLFTRRISVAKKLSASWFWSPLLFLFESHVMCAVGCFDVCGDPDSFSFHCEMKFSI